MLPSNSQAKHAANRPRWRLRVLVAILGVVWGPYLWSRIAATWRGVAVFSVEGASVTPALPIVRSHIRIVTYNIAHGWGALASNVKVSSRTEVLGRLDQIAALLRTINADVVILNEVDFDSTWTHSVDEARYLAEKAGYPFLAEQRNIDYRVLTWTWRFGNAVLAKHPIITATRLDLPGDPAWEAVMVGSTAGVACDIRVGRATVRVVGVHLSSFGEAPRIQAARALVAATSASPWPVVVAGDMNATVHSVSAATNQPVADNAFAVFDASRLFNRSPAAAEAVERDFTFTSMVPQTVIDWILIPRSWRFRAYSVDPARLSDHLPVIADVEFD